jgi:hypothetical protein
MLGRGLLGTCSTVVVLCLTMAGSAVAASGGQHAGISITANAGFQSCGCVTSGAGTMSNPYVIGPWAITSPADGSAITIDNSSGSISDVFTISGISGNCNDSNPADPFIHLTDVRTPTTISNVSANADGTGVELDGFANITLDGISVNKMVGAGLVIRNSSNVSVSNGKWKATADGETPHNEDGLYVVNSSNLQIGTAADCPTSGACNTFDYDSGWGVYLQNTHNVTIDHASANADDTGGYVLDGTNTYNVILSNSTAEAGGPICTTINGQRAPTGYHTDLVGGVMLINGAHDNTIESSTFNGTSTTAGYSIGDGGNGFYFDPCANQVQPFSPAEAPMGPNNVFSSICYGTTDAPGLPTSTCKS